MINAYRRLRRKVKGVMTLRRNEFLRPEEEGWCELNVTRVVWPPEVLDTKEVLEEIRRLTEGGGLLSKDDPSTRASGSKQEMEVNPSAVGVSPRHYEDLF